MASEFHGLVLLGGLSFFFFGLSQARRGLQLLAGDRLRLAISKLTGNRFTALSLGTLITVILQSSTATILMLISLASTGLLTLSQAFAVILGADIGTTLVVILLSIKEIADYSLLLVVIGFILETIAKGSKQLQYVARILFGFGLVFYGMKLMTQTAKPLAMDPSARLFFELIAGHPVAILLAAIIVTVLVQTSAATIGMAIALGLAGVLTLHSAIPLVLGANVGSCLTPLLASLTSDANGKRVAIAHLFVKVTGVVIAIFFIPQIAEAIQLLSLWVTQFYPMLQTGIAGHIALSHLLFNLALGAIFLPWLPGGVWIVSKLVPETKKEEVFGPKYLESRALDTPPLAFAQAKREILRIANLTYDLYRDALTLLEPSSELDRLLSEMESRDDKIDLLDREVRFYLAKLSQSTLTDSQAAQEMALLSVTADLEGVGDIISKELGRLAQKKFEKRRVFSKEGWTDIQKLHQSGVENFSLTISAFASPSEELVRRVVHQGEHFNALEQQMRQAHIQRLHEGHPEAFETSSIHLDVLGNLRRINDHMVRIAQLSL